MKIWPGYRLVGGEQCIIIALVSLATIWTIGHVAPDNLVLHPLAMLRPSGTWNAWAKAAALYLGLWPLTALVAWQIPATRRKSKNYRRHQADQPTFWLVSVLGPVSEEIAFRWLGWPALASLLTVLWSPRTAIFIAAVFVTLGFMLVHKRQSVIGQIHSFLAGAVLIWVMYTYGLVVAIAIHAFNNVLAYLVLLLLKSQSLAKP